MPHSFFRDASRNSYYVGRKAFKDAVLEEVRHQARQGSGIPLRLLSNPYLIDTGMRVLP